MRILTVCSGNICRSPAAAAAIAAAADGSELDVEVDSAGIGAWNLGEPPHPEAVAAARRAGLEVSGRARRVHSRDFDRFDIILAMDQTHVDYLNELAPSLEDRAKIRLFATYHPSAESTDIADPWGGPVEGYDRMVSEVVAAAAGLVDSLSATRSEDAAPLE